MQDPPTPEHDLAAVEQALAVRRLHREMRVPLNTILGQVQMLQTRPRDDLSVETRARAIEAAGLRLLDMLDGLLAAGAPLEGEHAQLRPVMLAPLIDQHAPGELSYRHGGDHGESVWADPGVLLRMLGVLGGLITTGGAPWGRAELSWQADGADLILVQFDAQWPPGHAPIDPLAVRLELLERLALMQQATFEPVQHTEGSLRLRLKLRRVITEPAEAAGAPPPHHADAVPAGSDILLVEDDLANAEVIIGYLGGRLGLSVKHVEDVPSAIDSLARHPPRLVLLDMYLPGEAGTVFLDHLRQVDPDHRLPCIVLTSAAGSGVERTVRAMGADDYLDKPVRLNVLRERVERLLAGPRG